MACSVLPSPVVRRLVAAVGVSLWALGSSSWSSVRWARRRVGCALLTDVEVLLRLEARWEAEVAVVEVDNDARLAAAVSEASSEGWTGESVGAMEGEDVS